MRATNLLVVLFLPGAAAACTEVDLVRAPLELRVYLGGTGTGTVTAEPEGVACGPTCWLYDHGSRSVVLTATAAPDSAFRGWEGACSGRTPECRVSLDSIVQIAGATFERTQHRLQLEVEGEGHISSTLRDLDCGHGGRTVCETLVATGTIRFLTAFPAPGWQLDGWSGAPEWCLGSVCDFVVNRDERIRARFSRPGPTPRLEMTVLVRGPGRVELPASGQSCADRCTISVPALTDVDLVGVPDCGARLSSWNPDCGQDESNVCRLRLTSPTTVQVEFTEQDGRLAHYAFDGTLTDALDMRPAGVAVGEGGPAFAADRFGQPRASIELDGRHQVDIGPASWLDGLGAFSGCVWARRTGSSSGEIEELFSRIQQGDGNNANDPFEVRFSRRGEAVGVAATLFGEDDRGALLTGGTTHPGAWHHVCTTHDGLSARLYVDGEAVGEASLTGALTEAPGIHLQVGGCTGAVCGNRRLHGGLDDLELWSRALDGWEVARAAGAGYLMVWRRHRLQVGRDRHATAGHEASRTVYVVGGNEQRRDRSVEIIHLDSMSDEVRIEPGPELPRQAANGAAAVVANHLLFFGGTTGPGGDSNTIHAAPIAPDGQLGAFRLSGQLPERLAALSVAVQGRRLFLVAAAGSTSVLDTWTATVDDAGMVSDWQRTTRLPRGRWETNAVVVGDGLYVVTGSRDWEDRAVFRAALLGEAGLGPWRELQPLPLVIRDAAVFARGRHLFVAGGYAADGRRRADILSAPVLDDGSLGPWVRSRSLPEPREALRAAVVGGRVVLTGGDPDANPASGVVTSGRDILVTKAIEPGLCP